MVHINDYLNSKKELEDISGAKIVALKNGELFNIPVDKITSSSSSSSFSISEYNQEGVLLNTTSSLRIVRHSNGTETALITTSTGTKIPLT